MAAYGPGKMRITFVNGAGYAVKVNMFTFAMA